MTVDTLVFLVVGVFTVAVVLLHLARLRMPLGGLSTPYPPAPLVLSSSPMPQVTPLTHNPPAKGTPVDFDDVLRALGCEG
ncbi:hypothetical protein SAMN00790413_05521 [Deinococcus hopiensis KR-140]|uniref:Uncharacterized protein n=1 Tax=Deinococcus hopiensis KR-140 TaxID=695939 RepID=A0A1W1UH60_9DEIO|nr:hypothetical protein SAMN00790413_05521 [Deinococcus hopiensis KR-140]